MFWLLLLTIFVGLLIRQLQRKRRLLKGLEHVPVIQYDIPFVGAGYQFLFCDNERELQTIFIRNNIYIFTISEITNTLIRICGKYAEPSIFWFGSTMTFLISNPDDLRTVFTSSNCLAKPYVYNLSGVTGLLNAPGKFSTKTRKCNHSTDSRFI